MYVKHIVSKAGDIYRKIHGKITKKPTNFSWIIDGKLAGTGRPMTRDEFDWLIEQGIGSVITMTEEPLEKSWVKGIDWLHLPTPDLEPPSSDSIQGSGFYSQTHLRYLVNLWQYTVRQVLAGQKHTCMDTGTSEMMLIFKNGTRIKIIIKDNKLEAAVLEN